MSLLTSFVRSSAADAIIPNRVKFTSGLYYDGRLLGMGNITANTAILANNIYAIPFWTGPNGFSADRFGFNVGTGSAGNARVGVYAADPTTLLPSNLLDDHGEVDVTGAAYKTVTISKTYLGAGPYYLIWLALVSAVTPSVRTVGQQGGGILGAPSHDIYTGYQRPFTYGALPDPFDSASGSYVGVAPILQLRKA